MGISLSGLLSVPSVDILKMGRAMGHILVYFKGDCVASAETMAGAETAIDTLIQDWYPGVGHPHDIRKEFRIVVTNKG